MIGEFSWLDDSQRDVAQLVLRLAGQLYEGGGVAIQPARLQDDQAAVGKTIEHAFAGQQTGYGTQVLRRER
jgi:hypothetical protein